MTATIFGFTGSGKAITEEQKMKFLVWIEAHEVKTFHHGDCIIADAFAHETIQNTKPRAHIWIHPPINKSKRAFCRGAYFEEEPKPYLKRDAAIVKASQALLAMPYGPEEGNPRSGTWATIRYARRAGLPIAIFWPDGKTTFENSSKFMEM